MPCRLDTVSRPRLPSGRHPPMTAHDVTTPAACRTPTTRADSFPRRALPPPPDPRRPMPQRHHRLRETPCSALRHQGQHADPPRRPAVLPSPASPCHHAVAARSRLPPIVVRLHAPIRPVHRHRRRRSTRRRPRRTGPRRRPETSCESVADLAASPPACASNLRRHRQLPPDTAAVAG